MSKTASRAGGSSQDRRRLRRATERSATFGTSLEDELAGISSLAASASGSTSLPLSDRDASWDGPGAAQAVAKWASSDGSGDKDKIDWGKYGQAFAWKDSEGGDAIGDYKLGFADVVDGKLTAVWKGVTAAAGAIQGARGGVQIPSGDVAGVKAKLAAYYTKAAKAYDDDGIKPPWAADAAANESEAALLAYAEVGGVILRLGAPDDVMATLELTDEYLERLAFWHLELGLAVETEELGGKPSKGTAADKRLRQNKAAAKKAVEDAALEAVEGLAASLGLTAAAGDVAWGPEDGFVDLLCDVNEQLGWGYGVEKAEYDLGGISGAYVRAIDAALTLDKVLICADGDYYVAPITMGDDQEPTLSDPSEWVSVESGWVETPDDTASHMRAALRDFTLVSDGALEPPMLDEHKPGEKLPPRRPGPAAPPAEVERKPGSENSANGYAWEAIFVPEGTLTDDGRAFAPGSLSWRELPLTLMAMTETSEGGHIGAEVAGRIDRMWREGNLIKAAGVFDVGEYGQEIARMVADGVLRGLSVDIAIHTYEYGPRSDFFDEDGNWLDSPPEQTSDDPPDPLATDNVYVITDGVIGMATVCPFPAFADANIALVAAAHWTVSHQAGFRVIRLKSEPEAIVASAAALEDEPVVEDAVEEPIEASSLTASAAGLAPLKPPAEWFANPELDELTPITITEDGRIFGHAWAWETCHIAFPDACVTAPHTETQNAYFHVGEIECADGEFLPCGKVTLDTGHAGQRLSRAEAIRHYDDTGTVAAHVCAGEDEFGGWVAGAIHPELSEEKLRILRGAALSGDWRNVNGNLELVALLAVNVPGFPVPRPRASYTSDEVEVEVLTLTAAGINTGPPTVEETLADVADIAATV